MLAERFAANPNVIGFDPLNKPAIQYFSPGYPTSWKNGQFDRDVLQPLYDRVFEEAYKKHNAHTLMHVQPVQVPSIPANGNIQNSIRPVGFGHLPRDIKGDLNLTVNDEKDTLDEVWWKSAFSPDPYFDNFKSQKTGFLSGDATKSKTGSK